MRIGRLRHRVQLQKLVAVDDGGGGVEEDWVDVATVWAAVEPVRGRERLEAMQLEAAVDHRVVIRYRPDIDGRNMRALHRGRAFHVEAVVNPDERSRWLELMCEERPA